MKPQNVTTATPVSDQELVRQAYEAAPSLPRLTHAIEKRDQINRDLESRTQEVEDLHSKLRRIRQGSEIADSVNRVLQSPLHEQVNLGSPEYDMGAHSQQIAAANRACEVYQRARVEIEKEISNAASTVAQEIATKLKSRQSELVQQAAAAARVFVDCQRAELLLHREVVAITSGRANDPFPIAAFYGVMTAESGFAGLDPWLEHLRRSGFEV